MMRSLFSGVSGIKNHQTRMDVVGNNIANVNTTGFKSSRATFTDIISQTLNGPSAPQGASLGGTNPKQVGLGVGLGSIDVLFTDGSVQTTGKNTDLCLSGSGLFIVKQGNETYYTRNGAFEFDAEGNYVMPGSGMLVQGWMEQITDAYGNVIGINTNAEATGIKIQAGKPMAPSSTTSSVYTGNLNAAEAVGTQVTTTITAYDTEGYSYNIPIVFQKTAVNAWTANITSPLVDENGTTVGTVSPTNITMTFSNAGILTAPATPQQITLTPDATARGTTMNPTTFDLDFSALTQYANESTLHGETNGYTSGTLKSVSIDSSGMITGVYTNGVRQYEGQVAVAQFNNASGLTKTGNSLYQESNNSGAPNVKTATALGVTITASALEMSNVDVANEFSDMIITQRGFQSNSKIVTVSDEMLETVINMKR